MSEKYETYVERVAFCQNTFGPPTDFRLEQAGDLDIRFTGWEISSVADGPLRPDKSTVDVSTFYSIKGSYVAEIVRHMPNRDGPDKPHVIRSKAAAFTSHLDMLKWLKDDGRGWLGDNSKVAWEEMCEKLPWLNENNAIRV